MDNFGPAAFTFPGTLEQVLTDWHRYYETARGFVMSMDPLDKERLAPLFSHQIVQLSELLVRNGVRLTTGNPTYTPVVKALVPATPGDCRHDFDDCDPRWVRLKSTADKQIDRIWGPQLPQETSAANEDEDPWQEVSKRKGPRSSQSSKSPSPSLASPRASTAANEPVRLTLGNLEPIIKCAAIEAHFAQYGSVTYVKVYTNILTGKDGPYVNGLVELSNENMAKKALTAARHTIGKRQIIVDRPRKRQIKACHVRLKGLPVFRDDEEIIDAIKKTYSVQILKFNRLPPAYTPAELQLATEAEAKRLLDLGCIEIKDERVEVEMAWENRK